MKNKKIKIKCKAIEKYITKLENEFYSNCDYDDKTVRNKTANLLMKLTLIDVIILILLGFVYGLNACMVAVSIFSIYLINKTVIDNLFNKEKIKILYQLPDFIDELKSFYYEKRMVTESLQSTLMMCPYEISRQAEKMLYALLSASSKTEVEKYNRECNNRFLKLLMNILYITKEYGDKNYDEKINELSENKFNINNSIFIKNLNFLLEEVNIEITKQNLFKTKFAGLIFVTIFPLLFINAIEVWSVSNFSQLSSFYNSFAGFILKNISVIVCIFMSLLIIKIKDSETNIDINKNKFNSDIERNKKQNKQIEKAKKIIKKLIPNEKSKQYNLLLKEIEKSNIEISPENYYINKIKYFIFSIAFMFVMFMSANKRLNIITNKIIFAETICIIIVGFLSMLICNFNLSFEKNIKKSDKENEINSFRSIILILIHYPFVSCEEILNYLEGYSRAYKNGIRRCINDYENNSEYAIKTFEANVSEKGMKKILRSLRQCVKNIKVSQAFAFLETERNFYKEECKYKNEELVIEKTNLGKMISMIPYYTLIILYFIVPMVYTGLNELSGLIDQIKNL